MRYEDGGMGCVLDIVSLFSDLIKIGMIDQLTGRDWQRIAQHYIDQGLILPDGELPADWEERCFEYVRNLGHGYSADEEDALWESGAWD